VRTVPHYLGELADFLWAVINDWAGYATGGVIVGLVGLWSMLKGIPPSRKFGVTLALTFLFFAFFNAWRERSKAVQDAQQEAQGLQKKLDDLTKPDLSGTIPVILAAPNPQNNKDSILTLQVNIENKGAPSIAKDIEAFVDTEDGKSVKGQRIAPPN
jgi:hypothetical protein